MVLSSLSRPLARSVGPLASLSTRGLSTVVPPAASSLRSSTSRAAGLVGSRQGAANAAAPLPGLSSTTCRSKLGPSTMIRSLTGLPREKVKVLMVLYDGGKHAEEVSSSIAPESPLSCFPIPTASTDNGVELEGTAHPRSIST